MRNAHLLLKALQEAGLNPTAMELADVLWLAGYLPTADDSAIRASATPFAPDDAERPARHPPNAPPQPLPFSLALMRAMRPLRRTVPSRTDFEVDEVATADTTAQIGVPTWLPVLRPAAERWLDVTVIADGSATMIVWQRWIGQLTQLLAGADVFRDVRVRLVDSDQPGMIVLRVPGGAINKPAELIDPTGRHVILMLSDCVGRAWRDGSMQRVLEIWARAGNVTIVQPLAERMWKRSGPEFIRARIAAKPGAGPRLDLRIVDDTPAQEHRGIPILVIRLAPDWIRWWASMISGEDTSVRTATALFTGGDIRLDPQHGTDFPPTELLGKFRASASPAAFDLAVRLSVGVLDLPVMRLIQSLTQPTGGDLQLAEVLLSGLLHRRNAPVGPPGDRGYDFRPGVRHALLSYLDATEAVPLLIRIGRFLHARLDAPRNQNIQLPEGELMISSEQFAQVTRQVLQRLGGRYAQAADSI
jgi:hypothetical protein